MFEPVLDQALDAFRDLKPVPIDIPEEFLEVRTEKTGLTIRNRAYQLGSRYELRNVHFVSPKIEITSLFLWPSKDWDLPIYAMEMVILGKQPIVGVIDAKNVSSSGTPCQLLPAVVRAFPDLIQATDQPDWLLECRSGDEIFIRPQSTADLDYLMRANDYALGKLAVALHGANPLPGETVVDHAKALQSYKDHHRIHSPGLPLMNKTFGEQWTDRYLRGYFFG